MLRKTLSLVLTLAILFGIVIIPCDMQKMTEDMPTAENAILTEDEKSVSSQVEVDGSIVKCVYQKDTVEYNLYLDDVKYDLAVEMYDGCAMVYLPNEKQSNYDDLVVGQSSLALMLTSAYWAPAIVAAAKTVISCVIAATAAVMTYYSAELIATTINDVKARRITRSDLRTKAKTATRALDLVKTAKRDNKSYYYAAYLYKGMVMVGNQISYAGAVNRLKNGYDVFASNYAAAWSVASKASKTGKAKYEGKHPGQGDRFPHFHPYGRKWYKNPASMPHCWFAY